MGRRVAILWHATFSVAAGVVYFYFVLPRWWELMGDTSHALGTVARIVAGVLIALAALPVVFTWLRSRKPEFGTPQLALTLQTGSIVAHVLAGVLIVGTAISEIWLSLDKLGRWLFGIYGAAAAVAVLGILGFYLSFVAELPPPPPKPLKPKKDKKQWRRRKNDDEADAAEEAAEDADAAEAGADEHTEANGDEGETSKTPAEQDQPAEVTAQDPEVESAAVEPESTADEEPTADDTEVDDTAAAEASVGGLRNRRPSGKALGTHRRRRTHRGLAVDD
jgi:hypothetical protein